MKKRTLEFFVAAGLSVFGVGGCPQINENQKVFALSETFGCKKIPQILEFSAPRIAKPRTILVCSRLHPSTHFSAEFSAQQS